MRNADSDTGTTEDLLFEDPLYCTFAELLHTIPYEDGLTPRDIWFEAKDCLHRLSVSARPDLMVSSLVDELCNKYSSGDTAAMVLICTLYMIGCQDKPGNPLWEVGKTISATVARHPLLPFVFRFQRQAEEREEAAGSPIPDLSFVEKETSQFEESHPLCYGNMLNQVPEDLRSCIADKERFGQFCHIIRKEILPFIQSDEGTAQMWEIVRTVSVELGYISNRCNRKHFAQLIEHICPEAGPSNKMDQNMQKYNKILKEKENDYLAIRSRFGI